MVSGWHTFVVRVPMAPDRDAGMVLMRRMERWLADNHRPIPLFHPNGEPRSLNVCVAIPVEQSEKALAYRAFCSALGISSSLIQWRVSGFKPPQATDNAAARRPDTETLRPAR